MKNLNYSVNKVFEYQPSNLVNPRSLTRLYPGKLDLGGWWYPSFQQFNLQQYIDFKEKPRCSGWSKDGSWSPVIVADNSIPIGGEQTCSGFRLTQDAPPNRKPADKSCILHETDSFCNIKCIYSWINISRFNC